jgi:hypothetical protein
MDVIMVSVIITALYVAVTLVAGFANHTRLIRDVWGSAYFAGLFALQTFSQLSIAFLIGFLVRKAFIALGIFLFYFMVFEPITVQLLRHFGHDEGRFLPLEISDRMIPVPAFLGKIETKEKYQAMLDAINVHVLYTVGMTILIWVFCYWVNKKRDLK